MKARESREARSPDETRAVSPAESEHEPPHPTPSPSTGALLPPPEESEKELEAARPVLVGMTTPAIEDVFARLGHARFRGRQVADWVYRRGATSFAEMTDLPLALRQALPEAVDLGIPEIVQSVSDADGTTKYLLRFPDGATVECVRLPYREWSSVCVSTQVGCPLRCTFCATGASGFTRNLTAGEIVAQFLLTRAGATPPLTHVVFMGMGEPLLNYNALLEAIRLLNTECGVGARNMTISTVGIVPGIERLAQERLQVNLALSLHAADDETRARLMPAGRRYPLDQVFEALRGYINATHRRVTLEYLLLQDVNDSEEDADRLARLIRTELQVSTRQGTGRRGLLPVVNLIPYNETEAGFRRPSEATVRRFQARLKAHGIPVTRRLERGGTVDAACGQLRRAAARRRREGGARPTHRSDSSRG